jgi:hypothetical protein
MTPAIHLRKQLLFGLLSLADLGWTWQLLHHTGGRVYEANPVANACLATFGWGGLVVYKLLAVLLVSGLSMWISRIRPATGGRVLWFACCTMTAVVLYSCSLSRYFGV